MAAKEAHSVSIFAVITTFGLPLWMGYIILRILGMRSVDDRYGFLGWMHVTGCLGIGLYVTAWMTLGLPLVQVMAIPLAMACAWCHWKIWAYDKATDSTASQDAEDQIHTPAYQRIGFAIVVVGILGFGATAMSAGSASAVTSGDEIRHWTFKAKMIYAADGFGQDFVALAREADRPVGFWKAWDEWLVEVWPTLDEDFQKHTPGPGSKWDYHLDYPLLNPLLHVWAYTCSGKILHWQNRFLITGFTLALMLILAGALRSLTQPAPLIGSMILLTVFGMVETMNALKWSLADGMVASGLLLTIDALRRLRLSDDPRWWRMVAIGLAVMLWSKNEGIMYLLCIALGCASIKLKPKSSLDLAWLSIPLGIISFTWISNQTFGFTNDLVTGKSSGGLERLQPLLDYFWHEIFTGAWWSQSPDQLLCNFLHLAFFGLLILFPKVAFGPGMRMVTATVLAILAGQLLVYLGTPHKLAWHLRESALRVSWQGISVVALWIGLLSHHLLSAKR